MTTFQKYDRHKVEHVNICLLHLQDKVIYEKWFMEWKVYFETSRNAIAEHIGYI